MLRGSCDPNTARETTDEEEEEEEDSQDVYVPDAVAVLVLLVVFVSRHGTLDTATPSPTPSASRCVNDCKEGQARCFLKSRSRVGGEVSCVI